jgi:NADH dehydrogenase
VLAAQVKLSPLVPVVGDGKTRFQPIAVEDIARCLVEACERDDTVERTIEAGGSAYYTYEEILDLIAGTLGAKISQVHIPLALMKPAVAVMEALTPRPPVTREQLKMLDLDNTTELTPWRRPLASCLALSGATSTSSPGSAW